MDSGLLDLWQRELIITNEFQYRHTHVNRRKRGYEEKQKSEEDEERTLTECYLDGDTLTADAEEVDFEREVHAMKETVKKAK
eukprot:6435095-Ditylum_brightwellii.AAC.1